MGAYRKLIMAVIGVLAMLAERHLGADLPDDVSVMVTDSVIALLTALGVWGTPNDGKGGKQ